MKCRIVVLGSSLLLGGRTILEAGEIPLPKFRAVEIDAKIEIGYGVTVADVDGDKKPDILLADKKQIVWYKNPTCEKFVIAENLTKLDNVCIAAADIDGDGKAEIAVGAGWNPSDTVGSGAVFYLIPPKDRTQKWEAVELPHEPTVHRMKWMGDAPGRFQLVVAPLHGRGNKDGQGNGAKILAYQMPSNPRGHWNTKVVNDAFHMTHNLHLVKWEPETEAELLVATKEGVFHLLEQSGAWKVVQLSGKEESGFRGAGEVRSGKLPGGKRFVITIEPMHGNQACVYTAPASDDRGGIWKRNVIDETLKEGHALACGDLLGGGFDQVVVGWRGKNNEGKTGIKVFTPLDRDGKLWRQSGLDEDGMACEDLCLADLNGDGRIDIIASGRATKNVKIYWNEHE
jgi:hypothetical protein